MKIIADDVCALIDGGATSDLGTAAGGLAMMGSGFVAGAGSAGAAVTAGVVAGAAIPLIAIAAGGILLGYGLYSFYSAL